MKRCFFMGVHEIFDAELINRLVDECEKIIGMEDQVEFWFFHGEHDAFIGSCLCLTAWLRTVKSSFPLAYWDSKGIKRNLFFILLINSVDKRMLL